MKAGMVLEELLYRENRMPAAAHEGKTVNESAFLGGDEGGRPGVTRLWIHPCDGHVTKRG